MKQEDIRYRWFTIIPLLAFTVAFLALAAFFIAGSEHALESFVWRWVTLGPLIALIPNGILLFLLLRTGVRKGTIIWFTFFVLLNIIWLLVVAMSFSSNTPEQAQFWYRIASPLWIPLPFVVYWFIMSYVSDNDLPPSPWMTIGSLLATFGLVYIAGASELVDVSSTQDVQSYFWGYEMPPPDTQLIVFIPMLAVIICTVVLLLKARRRTVNDLRRKQLNIFMFAFIQYMVLGIVLDVLIPNISSQSILPIMNWFYSTTLALLIGYGILKYGIFRISPTGLSNNILQSLSEAVLGLDEKMRIEFANKGAEVIFGYHQDWLKGEPLSKLLPPETSAALEQQMKGNDAHFELDDTTVLSKDRQQVPVTLSVGRVFSDSKKVAGYIVVVANITELKRKTIELASEKASIERKVVERTRQLSEEHARLKASIDSLRLGFFMTGTDDSVLIINQSAQHLFTMLAESQSIIPPANWDINEIARVFEKRLDLRDPISISRNKKKPMDIKEVQIADRFIHVFVAPVAVHDEVIGTVVLLDDITEEKILNRSKDEFFSIASHELRTPIAKIQGNAELMRSVYTKEITSEQLLDVVRRIEGDSAHMMHMVNSFLEMTELEQGKTELNNEDIDIVAIAKESMEYHMNYANKPDVQGEVIADAPIHITADRRKVRQLFDVYLSNAFKFTDQGVVTVTFERGTNTVKVRVKDTGKGIKVENQSLLFRKFQQAGSSLLTRDGEGTGIGLYVAKMLSERMGGSAGLETTNENQGSVFYFELPIDAQDS